MLMKGTLMELPEQVTMHGIIEVVSKGILHVSMFMYNEQYRVDNTLT